MLDRKKHRQEVESLKADNRMKDMELGKAYVDELTSSSSFAPRPFERARWRSAWRRFRSNIARPLQEEVKDLRMEIAQLRNAIQRIDFVFLGRDSAIPKQAWMALAAPSVGDCPHSAACPVRDSLQHEPEGD